MRYLIALIFPPLAVLLCWKPLQTTISLLLCLAAFVTMGITWVVAIIHAFAVVSSTNADRRQKELIGFLKKQHRDS